MSVTINDLLKGCDLLKDDQRHVVVQSIRNMELAFLTTEPEFSLDDRFENPLKVTISNRNYGHVRMDNPTNKDILVAPQVAVMTKYAAQNHAMTKSAFVPARSGEDYNDAGCIQGSQAGTIRRGEHDIRFMPVSIREMLLDEANKTGEYSHLYRSVDTLGAKTGVNTGHYLDRYFDKYDNDISEFIAHFERPRNCIGVVVLIDGEIVAVDKFPSFTYCAQVWDLLVRDCYGSLAIESMRANKTHASEFTKAFVKVEKSRDETTAAFLARVLEFVQHEADMRVIGRLQEVMDTQFEKEKDKETNVYQSYILKADGYIGQVISSGEYHHLVSIVKRDRFDPTKVRETLKVAEDYRVLAEKQREFAL